jgi:chemotaxis protein methyltransferase CheR
VEQIKMLADRGNLAAALKLSETLIGRDRLNPVGYYYQALLLDQITGHDAAIESLGKAVYLDRDFELAHYYRGLTYHKLGRITDAISSFDNVLRILDGRDRYERLPDADGMTVADLDELTRTELGTLRAV